MACIASLYQRLVPVYSPQDMCDAQSISETSLSAYTHQKHKIRAAIATENDMMACALLEQRLRDTERLYRAYESASLKAQEISHCLMWQAWLGIERAKSE